MMRIGTMVGIVLACVAALVLARYEGRTPIERELRRQRRKWNH